MRSPSSGDEGIASLLRRSHISSSTYDHDRRFNDRNSEDAHRTALEAAQAEHARVRRLAVQAIELSDAREANEKLRLHALQEEERVRIETERAQEECRLRDIENKARSIPKPAPRIPTPPPVQTPKSAPAPAPQPVQQPTPPPQLQNAAAQAAKPVTTTPQQPPPADLFKRTQSQSQSQPQTNPFQKPVPSSAQQASSPLPPSQPPKSSTRPQSTVQDASHMLPGAGRYMEIHQSLKQLRASIKQEMTMNKALKDAAGPMRRRITTVVGQLTVGTGVNKGPTEAVIQKLKEAFQIPCSGIDPSMFMLKKPQPVDGAIHNGDTLPSLYIYLLNIFAKAVVKQFASEAAADMYGVLVATIFANVELKWRDESMIDIMMAKMCHACPVLFGARGSEKTEQGRARLGWKREGGVWVTDQEHNTRMTGLGAGYAAISLRNFGRSKLKNPFPPYHYWQTLASIVSTPPDLASPTQYNVLKAMIDNFEARFLAFYGSAGRAALRAALIDFPAQALNSKDPAVMSLTVIADKLERDEGLVLR